MKSRYYKIHALLACAVFAILTPTQAAARLAWPGNQFWCVVGYCPLFYSLGTTMATGDFNNDGFEDLAMGAPYTPGVEFGLLHHWGAIQILLGSANGLGEYHQFGGLNTNGWLYEGSEDGSGLDFAHLPINGENFGAALATGDFNAYGQDDLAIGNPTDRSQVAGPETGLNTGSVVVIYNWVDELVISGDKMFEGDQEEVLSQNNQRFGHSVVAGDFDNNGGDDLVIGIPFEDVSTKTPGAVRVFYSFAGNLIPTPEVWHMDVSGVNGTAATNNEFGHAVTTGNFNCDDYADLAVGVPNYTVGGDANAGAVSIIYGSSKGLAVSPILDQLISQDSDGIQGGAEVSDHFGSTLAAGDFDNDGCDDLAIGVPQEDVASNTVSNGGAVAVIYGSAGGLSQEDQFWRQGLGMSGTPSAGNSFGTALAVGDFDGDGTDDLAIGAPFTDVGTQGSVGVVHVLHGSDAGLTGANDQIWHYDSYGILGSTEASDSPYFGGLARQFGMQLAAGDFDNNGGDDLAVYHFIDLGDPLKRGFVSVIYSKPGVLSINGFEADPD